MHILIDSDILLDVALGRTPHAKDAMALLDELEAGPHTGFVAWHTIANLYYLARGPRGKQETKDFIRDLLVFIRVAPASTELLRQALRLPMPDFEDAMQAASAQAADADFIATRNVKDYRRAPVPANRPANVLAELRKVG